MPTYLDIHDLPGVRAADVVPAHAADLSVQALRGRGSVSAIDGPPTCAAVSAIRIRLLIRPLDS